MGRDIKPKKEEKQRCDGCGTYFDYNLDVFENKKYCKACINKIKKDAVEREKLFAYMKKLSGEPVSPTSEKIIKYYHTGCQYTYEGMQFTLRYYYVFLHNNIIDSNFFKIIPYYYEKSKKFYIERTRLKESLEDEKVLDSQKINPIIINREDVEDYKEKRDKEWKARMPHYILDIDDIIPTPEELEKIKESGLLDEKKESPII